MNRLSISQIGHILNILPEPISCISTIRKDIHNNIIRRFSLELRKLRSNITFTDEIVSLIEQKCREMFLKAITQPGTPIGMITAEAIMAPMTQNALNSFHHTGTEKGAVTGLSASNEIVNASPERKDPYIIAHFLNKNYGFDEIYNLTPQIVGLSVNSLLKKSDTFIYEKNNDVGNEVWYDSYLELTNMEDPRNVGIPFQRLVFNIDKLFANSVTLTQICHLLSNERGESNGVLCIPSPTFMGIIDVYFDIQYFITRTGNLNVGQIIGKTETEKYRNVFYLISTKVFKPRLSNIMVRGIEGNYFMNPRSHETISLLMFVDKMITNPNYSFVYLNDVIQRIKGIPYIKFIRLLEACDINVIWCPPRVSEYFNSEHQYPEEIEEEIQSNMWPYYLIVEHDGGDFVSKVKEKIQNATSKEDEKSLKIIKLSKYWYAYIGGKNILGTMLLPFIDKRQIYGNSYRLFEKVLGVDIVRDLLIREYSQLLTDPYVNPIYIINQVNTQTCMGIYTATTAQSATRKNVGTLPQASFQQATVNFMKSAPFGKTEDVINTSSCIFLALPIKVGTGHFEAYKDVEMQNKFVRRQQMIQHWKDPNVNTTYLIPHAVKVAQIGTDGEDDLYTEDYAGLTPPLKPPTPIIRDNYLVSDFVMECVGINVMARVRGAVNIWQTEFDPSKFIEILQNFN
jgi:hypothetical protein